MLKSILSVFTGAFGMILKVMLVILLCFIAGYCLFSMLTLPFVWDGVVRLAGIAACVLLVRFLIRLGRDEDEEDDGLPRREDRP
jgi:hypothetical protein